MAQPNVSFATDGNFIENNFTHTCFFKTQLDFQIKCFYLVLNLIQAIDTDPFFNSEILFSLNYQKNSFL